MAIDGHELFMAGLSKETKEREREKERGRQVSEFGTGPVRQPDDRGVRLMVARP